MTHALWYELYSGSTWCLIASEPRPLVSAKPGLGERPQRHHPYGGSCQNINSIQVRVVHAKYIIVCTSVLYHCQQLAAARLRRSRRQHEETNVFENNRRFIRGAEEEVTFSLLLRLSLS